MAVDYQINLAGDLVSSAEERDRFNRLIALYLFLSAFAVIAAAYFSGMNVVRFIRNQHETRKIITTTQAVSGLDESAFSNPEQAYAELENYSIELASLRNALGARSQFFPVVHHLFNELPEGVVLQSLSTVKGKILFGINLPTSDESDTDPVSELKALWESNAVLMDRVKSIRPLKGERRTMGEKSMFYVQFECVLKK